MSDIQELKVGSWMKAIPGTSIFTGQNQTYPRGFHIYVDKPTPDNYMRWTIVAKYIKILDTPELRVAIRNARNELIDVKVRYLCVLARGWN
jgi:hypothetical protein